MAQKWLRYEIKITCKREGEKGDAYFTSVSDGQVVVSLPCTACPPASGWEASQASDEYRNNGILSSPWDTHRQNEPSHFFIPARTHHSLRLNVIYFSPSSHDHSLSIRRVSAVKSTQCSSLCCCGFETGLCFSSESGSAVNVLFRLAIFWGCSLTWCQVGVCEGPWRQIGWVCQKRQH